jgi:hypothetical protein
MRTTTGKPRIVGVTLGKAIINVIHPGIPPLTAEFGLVRDDEELAGLVEKRMEWSDRTMKAIAALQESMEEDMLAALFEVPPAGSPESEPEQV